MILTDRRWQGAHGIGRFTHEVLSRLHNTEALMDGPAPLSLQNLAWLPYHLYKNRKRYHLYYNPGFNPIVYSPIPFVFTIHDLIHLDYPGTYGTLKKLYYELLTKPATKNAYKIITVSDYSKNVIMEWAKLPEKNIVVAGNGISSHFSTQGKKHLPGYSYLLHTGNTKTHKNIPRLIEAFAIAKIDPSFKLILTGNPTQLLHKLITQHQLDNRVIFSGPLSENTLADYYRGAYAFLFPSLQEGFGIPLLEAMASGIPVLTSSITSMPEVAGDAALLVNPYDRDTIADGIERIVSNTSLRHTLIQKGFKRTQLFSWDMTAKKVQSTLDTI